MTSTTPRTLSVYVHIPFCSRRCDYCDFATWTDKSDQIERYIEAVRTQWRWQVQAHPDFADRELTSIFFGGGTPNLIDAHYVAKVIDAVVDVVSRTDTTEITVECNPDHVNLEQIHTYVAAGVNRISLGVQSTQPHVLSFLGREHTPAHVPAAMDVIRQAGISNINCDLIYGSGNESLTDWESTLNDVIAFGPQHISAYALGVEPGTPLGRSVDLNEKPPTDEDDLADKYEMADAIFSSNGYNWYEISNWSQPGAHSIHNRVYWRGGDVVALGCAAHGYLNDHRVSTPRNIDTYIERVESLRVTNDFESLFVNRDTSSSISREEEIFALALRTKEGISWPSGRLTPKLLEFQDEKLIEFDRTTCTVSLLLRGRLLAHRVSVDLFEEYDQLVRQVE